jgi:serine/threonine-protein kinase
MMSGPISERKPLVQIGAVLGGKYKVERVIAEGGMGIVVRALNIDLGSRFAVKVLHPDLKNDETAFARFLQEARGVAKLKSEHIVQMIDVSSKDGELPFMVMELLEGIDLDALVQLQGQLAPKVAAELTRQACNGVSCAHKAGIMHRDLKPANLFLSKKPSGDAVVKVLDFGLMKIKPSP